MKKIPIITLILSLAFIFISCDDNLSINTPENRNEEKNFTFSRSLNEAAKIAQEAIDMLDDSRASNRQFDINETIVFVNKTGRSSNTDSLYYVFNFDDNKGFAIIAYSKLHPGLIAITEEGTYDPYKTTDCEAFNSIMEYTKYNLQNLINESLSKRDSIILIDTGDIISEDDPVNPDLIQYKFERKLIDSRYYLPNYNLKWGQLYPEGYYCENGYCGCTNVAMAMIMSYLKQPQSIEITFSDSYRQTLNLDWETILLHHQSFKYPTYDNCYNNQHETIGLLCRQLAHLNNSKFMTGTTSTIVGKAATTFRELGLYATDYVNYTFTLCDYAFSNNGYIIATAQKDNSGHAFIIDGLKYEKWWTGEYIKRYGEDWELVNDHGTTETGYIHINWGWNGDYNGYFSDFDVYNASKYDNPDDKDYTQGNSYKFTNIGISLVTTNKQLLD